MWPVKINPAPNSIGPLKRLRIFILVRRVWTFPRERLLDAPTMTSRNNGPSLLARLVGCHPERKTMRRSSVFWPAAESTLCRRHKGPISAPDSNDRPRNMYMRGDRLPARTFKRERPCVLFFLPCACFNIHSQTRLIVLGRRGKMRRGADGQQAL
jgi:hypothetical protein